MIKKIAVLLLIFLTVSCTSTRPIIRTTIEPVVVNKPVVKDTLKSSENKNNNEVQLDATSKVTAYEQDVRLYISDFEEIAKSNMKNYGIPASIILAQGILESGVGKSKLAQTANNHFGIKCHTGWNGESVKHDDDTLQECFRKYTQPSESYRDHALFLTSRSRYANLFKLDKDDYEAWAKGLKEAGYATDKKYPDKLIGLIEKFQLFKYDNEVLSRSYAAENETRLVENSEDLYTIQQGDTLYSLSKKFNLSVKDLKELNNLSDNTISIGQKVKIK